MSFGLAAAWTVDSTKAMQGQLSTAELRAEEA